MNGTEPCFTGRKYTAQEPTPYGQIPAPGTFGTLIIRSEVEPKELVPSFLSSTSYYDFLSSLMITLFVIAIIVVFVYEYEALRRSKT